MSTDLRSSTPLEATARWTAAVRAGERLRPDRLLDDPWAETLAGPGGMAWLAGRTPESVLPIAVRTRYFDDWLQSAAIQGPVRQVVLLASGLDTRAWRLPWAPATTVFELDHGATLEAKADALARAGAEPACAVRFADADLATDWGPALLGAGLDPTAPTAWLAEGILFYLPDRVIDHVLATLTGLSTRGSRLGLDIVNGVVLTSPWTRAWIEMQAAAGAPWIGSMDDPAATLDALGWTASLAQPGEPGADYGRWTMPVPPAAVRELPHSWYVTAMRR
jgi:methyltransferase (TIGR00027 family)